MANEIKLKRGSGSDPSASDLVTGEVAVRTDNGKLFTKKDNGSVAEISGSGGIDDGDKGDITVSNSGATFTIDSGVVTSAKIADNTIVNADINSSAAIAGTKISPNFGTQVIQTKASAVDTDMFKIIRQDHSTSPLFRIFQDSSFGGGTGGCHLNTNNRQLIITAKAASTVSSTSGLVLTTTGELGIGENSPDEKLHIKNGNILLESTDAGSSAAPEFELYRNSASPADADYLGQLKFTGESDDGSKEVYAKMTAKIDDASSTTEDGLFEFALRKAGSNNICGRFTSTALKLINGTGLEVAANASVGGNLSVVGTIASELGISDLTSVTAPKVLGSNGIMEMKATISSNHTLTTGYNAIAVDPTIANGVTVTVPSGAVWSIV